MKDDASSGGGVASGMAPDGDAASKAAVKFGVGGAVPAFGFVPDLVFVFGAIDFGMGAGFRVASDDVFTAVDEELLAFFFEVTGVNSRSSTFETAYPTLDSDVLGFGVGLTLVMPESTLASERTTYDGDER